MAHELGHVLGVGHSAGCTLMNGENQASTCGYRPPTGAGSCRLLGRRDVRAAARRYGGPGVVQAASCCPLSPTRPLTRASRCA